MQQDMDYKFIQQIKKLDFVEKIILFGSRARGDNAMRTDIDLAIICPTATRRDWSILLQIIEEADTLLKIDCIRFDELPGNSVLKQNIEIDGKIIYEKTPH